jgi:hypothetical protein
MLKSEPEVCSLKPAVWGSRTIGSRHASRSHPSEKPARHQIVDDLTAHVRLETPEPRRLVERQLQARHRDELGAHARTQRITRAGTAANDLHARARFQESRQRDAQPLSRGVFANQQPRHARSELETSDIVVRTAGDLHTFVGRLSILVVRFVDESGVTALSTN